MHKQIKGAVTQTAITIPGDVLISQMNNGCVVVANVMCVLCMLPSKELHHHSQCGPLSG